MPCWAHTPLNWQTTTCCGTNTHISLSERMHSVGCEDVARDWTEFGPNPRCLQLVKLSVTVNRCEQSFELYMDGLLGSPSAFCFKNTQNFQKSHIISVLHVRGLHCCGCYSVGCVNVIWDWLRYHDHVGCTTWGKCQWLDLWLTDDRP